VTPRNSDIGGYYIAFYVDDVKAAKDYLDSKGSGEPGVRP
jgi:hypothetical protein